MAALSELSGIIMIRSQSTITAVNAGAIQEAAIVGGDD